VRPLNTSKETGQDPRGGDGRAFVLLAKGIPTGIKYTYSNSQYAPEGMGPRSGVHDGKGARRGTLVKGRTAFLHRMTQRQRVFAGLQSPLPIGEGSALLEK
jgi:hypothetical protein